MVDISALTGYTSTSSQSAASSSTLSADMNTFLKLLTTQLKYQDPTSPMNTSEFTNQLVMYSSVEQEIQMNSHLEDLLSLNVANLGAQAVSYIGKTAQVLGDVMPLENGKAKASYVFDKDVKTAVINIKDMNGNIVYSETGNVTAGSHEFTWDGKDSSGVQLEDGAYQILVSTSVADGESSATVTTTVFGRVTAVASGDSVIYVGLGDAVTAVLGDILTVKEDTYFSVEETTEVEDTETESLAETLSNVFGSFLTDAADIAARLTSSGII